MSATGIGANVDAQLETIALSQVTGANTASPAQFDITVLANTTLPFRWTATQTGRYYLRFGNAKPFATDGVNLRVGIREVTTQPLPTATPVPPTPIPTPTDTPSPTPARELPSTGGTVAAILDQLQITFTLPSAAVSEPIRVRIKAEALPPATSGFQVLGQGFTIQAVTQTGAPVTQFAQPFTLHLHYSEEAVQDLDESQLTLHYWHETQQAWLVIPTTVDIERNVLTATLDHLTTFAVLQEGTGNQVQSSLYLPLIQR